MSKTSEKPGSFPFMDVMLSTSSHTSTPFDSHHTQTQTVVKKCEALAAHPTIRVESLLMRNTHPLAFGHVFLATTFCVPGKAEEMQEQKLRKFNGTKETM